nr:MAG: nonstructural protein [Microvirus sp.]
MKMLLFAVHDSKAGYYSNPQMYRSLGEASRAFEANCRDKTTVYNQFPADFTLVQIGEYDLVTGTLFPCPLSIVHNASEFQTQFVSRQLENGN